MANDCVYCRREVKDFKPIYCCSGQDCGCYGLPIEPPMHKACAVINALKGFKILRTVGDKHFSLSSSTEFPGGKSKLYNVRDDPKRVISSEDITQSEVRYIMDLVGMVGQIDNWADYLIEQLGGNIYEENPEKINNRTEILDL